MGNTLLFLWDLIHNNSHISPRCVLRICTVPDHHWWRAFKKHEVKAYVSVWFTNGLILWQSVMMQLSLLLTTQTTTLLRWHSGYVRVLQLFIFFLHQKSPHCCWSNNNLMANAMPDLRWSVTTLTISVKHRLQQYPTAFSICVSLPASEESTLCTDKSVNRKARQASCCPATVVEWVWPLSGLPCWLPSPPLTPSSLQHPAPITPDPQEVDTMDWK